jgi:hypothetical protein
VTKSRLEAFFQAEGLFQQPSNLSLAVQASEEFEEFSLENLGLRPNSTKFTASTVNINFVPDSYTSLADIDVRTGRIARVYPESSLYEAKAVQNPIRIQDDQILGYIMYLAFDSPVAKSQQNLPPAVRRLPLLNFITTGDPTPRKRIIGESVTLAAGLVGVPVYHSTLKTSVRSGIPNNLAQTKYLSLSNFSLLNPGVIGLYPLGGVTPTHAGSLTHPR